jgi:methionine--tRNA ligase beta chain
MEEARKCRNGAIGDDGTLARKMPTREELTIAIGKILFLKLSKEDGSALLKDMGATPDWSVIANFTRQALKSTAAARTIATHFVKEVAVLNAQLEPQVFIGGEKPSVADVACYIALVPAMAAFPDEHKWALCNASRWFDHMQHFVASLSPPKELQRELVSFNYNVPTPLPTVASLQPLVGTACAPTAAAAAAAMPTGGDAATSTAAPTPAPPGEVPPPSAPPGEKPATEKKEKKEKKEKADDKPAKPQPVAETPEISWCDFRVGKIVDAKAHPESDKLYVETIDLGEEAPRQILSGLAHHMPLDKVKGAMVVCICNLKARKIGGMESAGMVLCAGSADKSQLGFVTPPAGAAPGERVSFEGYEGGPESASKMDKKKAWEMIQPLLHTTADGVCCYKEKPFTLASGVCTASVPNGGIS